MSPSVLFSGARCGHRLRDGGYSDRTYTEDPKAAHAIGGDGSPSPRRPAPRAHRRHDGSLDLHDRGMRSRRGLRERPNRRRLRGVRQSYRHVSLRARRCNLREAAMKIADLYQSVTNAIVADLEKGVASWVKPWQTGNAGGIM